MLLLLSLQGAELAAYPYGTFSLSPIRIGRRAVVSGLCVLAGPGASLPDGAVLPPNSSSTDPGALERGRALGAEGLRLADAPVAAVPALLALLALVLFESLMLVPATIGVMLLWDHLAVSTSSIQDTAAAMLSCWAVPEMRRGPTQQAQCQEMALGELVSVAAFVPLLLLSNLAMLPLVVAPLKWLMMGRVTEATLAGRGALRRWATHTFVIVQRSPHVRLPALMIQGTEAFNVFLRMVGYKVGRQAWVGNHNMSLVAPDLVTIGDAASMGSDSHLHLVTPTAAGRITFGGGCDAGHQVVLFPGARLLPGSVLGAKSNLYEGEALPAGAVRLGTALLKPGKGLGGGDVECGGGGGGPDPDSDAARLVASRLVGPLRYAAANAALLAGNLVLIPLSYSLISLPMVAVVMVALYEGSGVLVGPALLLGFALGFMLNCLWLGALRRLLVPRTPGTHAFWSPFFVRWMLWTGPFCVATLAFTPYFGSQLIVWFYRSLGTRIGRGCCIGGGYSAEPDAFTIGDGCVLDAYSAASNHTIERRQLSIGRISLGARVTLGAYGVVFPGTEVEDGAVVGSCSVVLKGERVTAGSRWRGIPAEPAW